MTTDNNIQAIVNAVHPDPFGYLGLHTCENSSNLLVRCFFPDADAVTVIDSDGKQIVAEKVADEGLFVAKTRRKKRFDYQLLVRSGQHEQLFDDAYRFPQVLGEIDLHLLNEGTHRKIYEVLGAHPRSVDGVDGFLFALWAPNASRVAVVGDFNNWDGRCHGMRRLGYSGFWEIFIPGVTAGHAYKYELKDQHGHLIPLKADPLGAFAELRPSTASLTSAGHAYDWQDGEWLGKRAAYSDRSAAISIYEVHLGSWRRHADGTPLNYREIADQLIPYVLDMGFTHLQFMPVSEYPFDGSWGYQPVGLFAPTARYGSIEDFQYLIDRCHAANIGVLIDWVPGHFPSDAHGLARFDGSCLYEHADPREGYHPDWNTYIYNYGRTEVANFLRASAIHWLDNFHIDGIRVDAVASMLYRNYSRKEGEWIPNQHGGHENLEAIDFLRSFNSELYGEYPGAFSVAEESTAWPGVSKPVHDGGLGFGYKWNMGWMNDTLEYMSRDPIHRRHHHDEISFGLVYAFDENFVLPLSHDEVVHGKGSILARMPGDDWQKFANLRAYYGFMWTHPGKKLLFMGCEFAQGSEWNHDAQLSWQQLDIDWHRGVQSLVRDLNQLYRNTPALHEMDCEAGGFEWIDHQNADHSIYSFVRKSRDGANTALVVCNFTPQTHSDYRIGVPNEGYYREVLNSDAGVYGGSNQGNGGGCQSDSIASNGREHSLSLTIPPLSTLVFVL